MADGGVTFDRAKLREYRAAKVGTDLLKGIEHYTPKDESDESSIAPLGPFLNALHHRYDDSNANPLGFHHFVSYRNNLNKILQTPYNSRNPWTFQAEKRDGCVYLDVRKTEQDKQDMLKPMDVMQKRAIYAGRRFELVSTRSSDAEAEQEVNENEEYCGIFSFKLHQKRLLVAAELDCEDAESHEYIELKTFRQLVTDKDQFVFEKFKLLAFWIQSYMVGVPTIVCGFRDEQFRIQKLQKFATNDLPRYGRRYWNQHVCLNFASELLDWIYANALEGQVYRVAYEPANHWIKMCSVDEPNAEVASFVGNPLRFT